MHAFSPRRWVRSLPLLVRSLPLLVRSLPLLVRSLPLAALALLAAVVAGAREGAPEELGAGLLNLPGELVPVRYSSGSLQRASQLQPVFELLARELDRGTGRRQRLPLALLSRQEWDEAELGMSYGLPARLGGSSVALPAWGDSGSVELWKRLLARSLPAAGDAPLRSTADEAASLIPADLLGLFEGSRLLMEGAGIRGAETWVGEVVAHTLAASVAPALDGGAQADGIYRRLGELRGGAALPLAGYRSGISLEEWLWYQARFFEAASLILSDSRRGGRDLLKRARRNGGSLTRAELIARHPALEAWLANGFSRAAE